MKWTFLLLGLLTASVIWGQTDNQAIEEQIRAQGLKIVEALNKPDLQFLVGDFHQSDESVFIINGYKMVGYEAIKNAILGIPNRRKSIEVTVKSDKVMVLGPESAMHIVDFAQVETALDDSVSTAEGTWTSVYRKFDDEWKVVLVHESYFPTE